LKRSQKSLLSQSAGGGQVSVLGPRFNASGYFGLRVEDLSAFGGFRQQAGRVEPRPRRVIAGDLEPTS